MLAESSDLEEDALQRPPKKLRSRIMASGYRYKPLNDDTARLDLYDEDMSESQSCTNRPSTLRKFIVLMFLMIIGLVVAITVLASARAQDTDDHHDFQICQSPKCVESSAFILEKMNLSADPCTDMYQYACGGWMNKALPSVDYGRWSEFTAVASENSLKIKKLLESEGTLFKGKNSSAIAKLKSYYRRCMDQESIEKQGTEKLLQLINNLGSWTVTTDGKIGTWNKDTWSLQNTLTEMHKIMAYSLFGFTVDKDVKNATRTIISFTQAGLTLAYEGEYKGNDSTIYRDAFMKFAVKVGILLGGNETHVKAKMSDVLDFETKLAEIYLPAEELTDPLKLYNKKTIQEFQDMLGLWIDIKKYLTDIFGDREFSDDKEIIVLQLAYFEKLKDVIESTETEILANYIMWHMVQSLTGYLPRAFARASLTLSKVERGVTSLWPQWKRCITKTEVALGFASSALYIEAYFSPTSKKMVKDSLEKIRHQFIANLNDVDWLDHVTRARLAEKAEAIKIKVGYPDWILNSSKLDERYDKFCFDQGDFLSNKLCSIRYGLHRELEQYGKPPDLTEWHSPPDVVNAFYSAYSNMLMAPAGILQPPFFTPDFPKPFTFGTIGTILGHELTHGFDNKGRNFDKYGNLQNMWTQAAAEQFKRKVQCMTDQYSSYTLQGHHVHGKTTMSENIADNGGVKLAYKAYKAAETSKQLALPGLNLTNDQLFFLGFSQVWCAISKPEYEITALSTDSHPPPQFRVIGSLSNRKEFADAFNCGPKKQMNPSKRCEVW